MRILFINTTCGYVGGVEQNIALVAAGLADRGHTCSFAYLQATGKDPQAFATLFSSAWSLEKHTFPHILAVVRPDIVYIHKFDEIQPIFDALGNIPIVRMFHDHDIYCPRRHKYLTFSRHICTWKAGIACYADLAFLQRKQGAMTYSPIYPKLRELWRNRALETVVVGSSYMRSELIRNGFPAKTIHVLAPAVSDFPQPPVALHAEDSVLFVGQLVRGKGVDTLVRAVALMRSKVVVHIVGTGNDEHFLYDLTRQLGLAERVVFHGWVAHGDLSGFYDDARIVTVPSRWPEPFGMVGVEAMLRRRPVVASRVGGIPDWLVDGETGTSVPCNDPQALADALDTLVEDTDLAIRMGEAGRKRAMGLFAYGRYMDELERLFQERCICIG